MKILSLTNGTQIAANIEIADNFFQRFKGLMLRKELPYGHALLLTECRSIHTYFMRFTIDAVFIDKSGKIVHIERNLKPGRVTGYIRNAYSVIELPEGTVNLYNISEGQQLVLCEI